MVDNSVSQLPVLSGEDVVGCLTESVVLNRLIDEPGAKDHTVSDIMGDPLTVVDASMPVRGLSGLLREAPGAVLVRKTDGALRIITKSDLIEALASRTNPTA